MDVLVRSVLEAGSRVDLPTMTLNRHLEALRTAVALDEQAVLVLPCNRADRRWQGDLLLTVTRRRLVLTRERFLRGVHVYLDADRAGVTDVRWGSDGRMPVFELSFDHGHVRYVLWFPAFGPQRLIDVEAAIEHAFGTQGP